MRWEGLGNLYIVPWLDVVEGVREPVYVPWLDVMAGIRELVYVLRNSGIMVYWAMWGGG